MFLLYIFGFCTDQLKWNHLCYLRYAKPMNCIVQDKN